MLSLPVDVLVATPGRLLQLVDKGSLFLGDVRHVIVDEVDTMFEAFEINRDGFAEPLVSRRSVRV